MHEHEPPQATVEPAPVSARGPAAPAGLVGMPAIALALQRSAGNRYVSRAVAKLAREEVVDEIGGAIALEETGGDPLQQPAPSAPAAPTPSFDHSGGSTVTIDADSAVEFSQKIVATIGAPHVAPEFTPDIAFDDIGGPGGKVTRKITSIGLTVKTSIHKVRFGMGRVDADNRAMIGQMVQEIQAHEQRHRKIIEDAATAALADVQKLVGTSKVTDAQTALTTTLECTANKKHEALDGTEGLLTVSEVRQPNGKITLTLSKSGSGAKYPCKK